MSTELYYGDERDEVEYRVSADRLGLTLTAERYEYADAPSGDMGPLVPVATGDAFRSFISRQAWNDPNGTWASMTVDEGDGALICDDYEWDTRHVWQVVGRDASGRPLYRIDGLGEWSL